MKNSSRRCRHAALVLTITSALAATACDKKEPSASESPTKQASDAEAAADKEAPPAYRCLGEPGFFGGVGDAALEDDTLSFLELRDTERGSENRLVTLSIGTGEAKTSDWFRRRCSRTIRFHEGYLASCVLSERRGHLSEALYYFKQGKLDAASIDSTPAIGTRTIYRLVGNADVAYYQTTEKEIFRLTPDLKSVLVAKGTPRQIDRTRLIYVDEAQKWNSLPHDAKAGKSTPLPGLELSRDLPGGGRLTKNGEAFVAEDATGKVIDASALSQGLKFFAGNTAMIGDESVIKLVTLKDGKLSEEELLSFDKVRVMGLWSRDDKPYLLRLVRDSNLDGEIASGDRAQFCLLENSAKKLSFPERTEQEKKLQAVVERQIATLGIDEAKWSLQNFGSLLAVNSLQTTEKSPEELGTMARQIHEAAKEVDDRIHQVLLRHQPQLRQGLSRLSDSGKLLRYAGDYGALLPNESDFGFSYDATLSTVTGGGSATSTAGLCLFKARSLSQDPVKAQFDCQLLGPGIHWREFKPGEMTNLDDPPELSELLELGPTAQNVKLRAPGDRNKKAGSFQSLTRGGHIEKVGDGFDTRLVSVGKQWMALGKGMENQGARFVDPNYNFARPFAHAELLPRLQVESSLTDDQVKPLAKKLLKLLNSHLRVHLKRKSTTFFLRRGDQNGRYDGNTGGLKWEPAD